MNDKTRPAIPATSVLVTFECVARLGSMTHAARELGAPVSSVSRCISLLERQLSIRLFDRTGSGMQLTEPARRYYESVRAALGLLQSGTEAAVALSSSPQVSISCCHDASYLLIMPRFAVLESLLGERTLIRLLTYHRHVHELRPVDVADIELLWRAPEAVETADEILILKEEIQPVCSPLYRSAHAAALQGASTGWGPLRLLHLEVPVMGLTSWNDWFAIGGRPESTPSYEGYDSYTQVLEAAVAGRGVALGLKHCVEGYFERGALVPLYGAFVPFGGRYIASLTAKGRGNPLALKCLEFFSRFD
ncbi:MAG: LysR family transcriptional regulator [Rhodospirillaceae bacterium]|nr:LysR family transcriptional regulator [Rhodospirillaceae bacterium]